MMSGQGQAAAPTKAFVFSDLAYNLVNIIFILRVFVTVAGSVFTTMAPMQVLLAPVQDV
jgi:hypothetical protein